MDRRHYKINTNEIGYIYIDNPHDEHMSWLDVESTLNNQANRIHELEEALKNSFLNEICENCKYGDYDEGYYWSDPDFTCRKGHDSADCDGLKECKDFKLNI